MASPRAAITVIASCAFCSVCSDRRRAFAASRSIGSTGIVDLLGARAISAGASGRRPLAARRLCAQTGDDREQVPLDGAVHLNYAVLPAVLRLADQSSGRVELTLMLGQELFGGDENRAGQALLTEQLMVRGRRD